MLSAHDSLMKGTCNTLVPWIQHKRNERTAKSIMMDSVFFKQNTKMFSVLKWQKKEEYSAWGGKKTFL